jgi:hypothetical protein
MESFIPRNHSFLQFLQKSRKVSAAAMATVTQAERHDWCSATFCVLAAGEVVAAEEVKTRQQQYVSRNWGVTEMARTYIRQWNDSLRHAWGLRKGGDCTGYVFKQTGGISINPRHPAVEGFNFCE